MTQVILRFTTRWPPNPASLLIARMSGSKIFSHTMLIHDGLAYEASMTHGCRVVEISEAMTHVSRYQDMYIDVPDVRNAVLFGLKQQGKPYDFAGAFGIPFMMSEDWQDDGSWWCSELNFMQLGLAGVWMLDKEEHKRVTPNHLHMCNYPKGEHHDC